MRILARKLLKFASIATIVSTLSNCGDSPLEGQSQINSFNPQNVSLTFAPPWWMPDYSQFLTEGGEHFTQLKANGYDTIKLWMQHIRPGGEGLMNKGRFAYGCNAHPWNLNSVNCPYYIQAVKALNSSGMKIAIETPLENPSTHFGTCLVSGQQKALAYGKEVGKKFFDHTYKPWLLAGGRIDTISIDGPLDKTLATGSTGGGCGFTNTNEAMVAVTGWMEEVKHQFSLANLDINFVYLVNFPWWKSAGYDSNIGDAAKNAKKGDFTDVITRFTGMARMKGLNLTGVEIDNPLTFMFDLKERGFFDFGNRSTATTVKKIKATQKTIQRLGLQFSYILITGVKHISPESFPIRYNDNLAKFFVDETIVYGDIIRAHLGDYLHNLTVQSWLESPYYIFNNNGQSSANRGFFYAATNIGKRAQAGFCDLREYSQSRGINFSDLASANRDYFNVSSSRTICMPVRNEQTGTCTPYFYLIDNPTAFDTTIDAVAHQRSNGGSCRPDGAVAQELYETSYDGRATRILRSVR